MSRRSKAKERSTSGERPGLVGRIVRGFLRAIWATVWRVTVLIVLITGSATLYYYADLPQYDELFDGRGSGSVTLRDVNGNIFAWRGEQYGGDLHTDDVSPHLVNAVIAAEDKRYHSHFGIDPRGIARAMFVNLREGRLVQGGSTLTQQVAKNVFLDARRKLERKLKEVPMALALELKYSKKEILSIYLNRVYLGAGTNGFEAASQRYFGKSARVVSAAEAAMLAGLLKAPSRLAPTRNLANSQDRSRVIIRLMNEQGYLTTDQSNEALKNPAQLSQAAAARAGGAFADWLMERGGEDRFLNLLKAEDIEIETTFDPKIQRLAEQALADVFDRKVRAGSEAQAAIVVMTHDGAVRAMVGGRERGAAQFNRATQALRQPGSAFKPVVFAAALESGMSPSDQLQDAPIKIGNWSPTNYTNRFLGAVSLNTALAKSINTVAVRVSEKVGREKVSDLAGKMGLTTPIAPGPATALGTSEVRMIELAGVYATIANGGRVARPTGVAAIRLRGDDVPIDTADLGSGPRAISPETAGLMTFMLHDVVQEGTGKRAQLEGWEIAGKTGTTQRARDAWFIGYSAQYVTAVWMGYDDNRPLTGVTGGGLPAEIFSEVMKRLHEGQEPVPLKMIKPKAAQIVLAPSPAQRSEASENRSANRVQRTQEQTVVEEVFQDVLDGLRSGGDGDLSREREWRTGNDL